MLAPSLFAKVEDVFEIPGRGTVVVPAWLSDQKVRTGDLIELRTSSGEIKKSRIASVEFLKQNQEGCRLAFMLSREITAHDIAVGTEIWLSIDKDK